MKKCFLLCTVLIAVFFATYAQQPLPVTKTNTKPVYMHIMPWFDGPKTLGAGNWGYHWKMQKMNPNIVDGNGKRQIASHYYPQIGPYDSSDPDVIDYQLLLMKLAGVDGILIDWYGTAGNVGDIGTNLRNSDSIANRSVRSGLKFGLVIEDRFTGGDVNIQKNSMIYAKNNYFTKANYFKFGTDNAPVVGIFGPDQIQTEAGWTSVFSGAGIADNQIQFLPLEYQGGEAGMHTDGEYAWPYQTPNTSDHAMQVENFYKFRAPQQKIAMGVLYPGFNDFYAQGENGGVSYFNIPANGTQTLSQMITLVNQYTNDIDIVQLASWNDYGEGTMFEPTQEFGYSLLVRLQQYTGVSYTEEDLKQVTRFFNLRKQYANDASVKAKLDQVYRYMAALQLTEAKALMCTIDNAAGCIITPTVTITSAGSPAEGGANGTFTITASNLAANLIVNYTISGTASTADYTASPPLSGSVTLSVTNPSATITITPVNDLINESNETLILTLSAGGYTIGQSSSATLTIIDNDPLPVISGSLAAAGNVGVGFNYNIVASNSTSYSATGLPTGLSINTTSGAITGTPTAAGTSKVTIKASNAAGADTKELTITVTVLTPTVSITSAGSLAEGGATGTFNITATNVTSNLTVTYTISGTASAADYTASPTLSGSVILTQAQPSITITVTAIDDAVYEGAETLVLTLSAGSYTIDQSVAQLTIADNDPMPCTAPIIAYTATAPVIDQTIDNVWLKAPAGTLSKVTFGTMPTDFTGSKWRAMYDNNYLYALVEVKDNQKINDSGTSWWEDDAVEIFIDGDNSKGNSYDGENDYQIAFRYNDLTAYAGSGAMNVSGVSFAIQNKTDGYNLEVRIPWSAIGITPSIGKPIGLDIAVDDDDNGAARDAQVSAFATNATAYQNPTVFGTVYFTTACAEVTPLPEITAAATASGVIGTAFNYSFTASNNPTTYGATGLPAGLSVNTATGVISGMPTQAGTSTVTLTAKNEGGTGSKQISITITAPVPKISITSAGSPAEDGATGAFTITASNIYANVTVNYTLGGTASQDDYTSNPALSGSVQLTVAQPSVTFTITPVNDLVNEPAETLLVTLNSSANYSITQALASLDITDNDPLPEITGDLTALGTIGSDFIYHIFASNSPTSYSAGGLPEGLVINTSSGEITGVPIVAGSNNVTITAANAAGSNTKVLTIVINAVTTSLDLSDLKSFSAQLVPNPIREGLAKIVLSEPRNNVNVEISDLYGVTVYQSIYNTDQDEIPLHLSGISSGVYLLKLQSGEQLFTQKFIVQ